VLVIAEDRARNARATARAAPDNPPRLPVPRREREGVRPPRDPGSRVNHIANMLSNFAWAVATSMRESAGADRFVLGPSARDDEVKSRERGAFRAQSAEGGGMSTGKCGAAAWLMELRPLSQSPASGRWTRPRPHTRLSLGRTASGIPHPFG